MLVKCMLSGESSAAQFGKLKKLLEFDDCRYYALKYICSHLKKTSKQKNQKKTLKLISNLRMPKSENKKSTLNNFSAVTQESGKIMKLSSIAEHKRLFTFIWLEFLKQELIPSVQKEVLVILPDMMPYMTSPLQLADYLTEAYNAGGATSLLALNGIFILVNSYNLDYPNFYKKVYSLLEPSIFHVKYRPRFLFLLDLFLSSTHIPAYLVGAFIKKMSRLSLTAPPDALICVLPMIFNWIVRHPACKILIHRPNETISLSEDPYDYFETDPAKSMAMESSLWELKSLENHYDWKIAEKARKITDKDVLHENDISNLFEKTLEDMMTKELQKTLKEVSMNSILKGFKKLDSSLSIL